ncbi:hypothetical protein [Bacillus toyonensis]|uniref:hypothetical protein n=1 Tax=Bacillus toyonensis TaxID=155322 RepID=UPI000BECF6DB|nr:hypothetical protein [Bacillus toyonensis]PEC36187.1 hypothetical protein CON60_28690 [Bacillus toyonensis]PED57955.1 hypothetical protein CON89_28610 [Bacillus toyonensis]PEJ93158.1 hypothetical protein CN687_16535 [Bacillus toyonensis]PEL03271.1 hypothetical protein CN614_23595 [Bacillus toyonensis]PEN39119.1 hypothetical protein CN541_12850 [Bacillus toyonensis]
MNQYQMLYSTPYLYSSRTLKQMYKATNNEENVCAIQEHMRRHEVYLARQYRVYYYLSQKIEEDLYGGELAVSWNQLLDEYQLFKDGKGNLSIKPKGWG